MNNKYLGLIFFLFFNYFTYSQNKFFLQVNLVGRNIESYKYLKSSPYSPDIKEFNDISWISYDLGGERNYSFYLKYQINNYLRTSIGYEYYHLFDYFAVKPHTFCLNCNEGYGYGFYHSHSFPLQMEFTLPILKCSNRLKFNPILGINIIYNSSQLNQFKHERKLEEYRDHGYLYAINSYSLDFDYKRHWNLGLRYGVSLEYNIYKDIRINVSFYSQTGLYEIQRTHFEIDHQDILFNQRIKDNALWINKQTFKTKSLGVILPMDRVIKKINFNGLKEIFKK